MKKLICIFAAVGLTLTVAGCRGNIGEVDVMSEDATENAVTKCFIGTVLEESDTYMYVEPDEGEEERELSDSIGVFYTTIHKDYFYGTGRRVVVYYQSDAVSDEGEIVSDDISTEGFRDFEIIVEENGQARFERVLAADEADSSIVFNNINVKTYGVDVKFAADGKMVSLQEALEKGFITPQAITARANRDVRLNQAKEITYRDGGSREYVYDGYKIIKYHTEDGKRDLYIGNLNMKYSK